MGRKPGSKNIKQIKSFEIKTDDYIDKVKLAIKHESSSETITYGNSITSQLFEIHMGTRARPFFQFGGLIPKFTRKLQRSVYTIFNSNTLKLDLAIEDQKQDVSDVTDDSNNHMLMITSTVDNYLKYISHENITSANNSIFVPHAFISKPLTVIDKTITFDTTIVQYNNQRFAIKNTNDLIKIYKQLFALILVEHKHILLFNVFANFVMAFNHIDMNTTTETYAAMVYRRAYAGNGLSSNHSANTFHTGVLELISSTKMDKNISDVFIEFINYYAILSNLSDPIFLCTITQNKTDAIVNATEIIKLFDNSNFENLVLYYLSICTSQAINSIGFSDMIQNLTYQLEIKPNNTVALIENVITEEKVALPNKILAAVMDTDVLVVYKMQNYLSIDFKTNSIAITHLSANCNAYIENNEHLTSNRSVQCSKTLKSYGIRNNSIVMYTQAHHYKNTISSLLVKLIKISPVYVSTITIDKNTTINTTCIATVEQAKSFSAKDTVCIHVHDILYKTTLSIPWQLVKRNSDETDSKLITLVEEHDSNYSEKYTSLGGDYNVY